jgi:TolA-binding protein
MTTTTLWFMLLAGVAPLFAQSPQSATVCVAADRVLRFAAPGQNCPRGDSDFQLLLNAAELIDYLANVQRELTQKLRESDQTIGQLRGQIETLSGRLSDLQRESDAREDPADSAEPATTVKAPFEVLDRDGRTLFRVTESEAPQVGETGGGIPTTVEVGNGHISIMSAGPALVQGRAVPQNTAEKAWTRLDKNGIKVYGPNDTAVVTLEADAKQGNSGSLKLMSTSGNVIATMGSHPGYKDAGTVSIMNAQGKPVAGLTIGVGSGGGAVLVADNAGAGLAQMTATKDGRGMFQVFAKTGQTLAVMTQAPGGAGGLLQISSATSPVVSLSAGQAGTGLLQLTDQNGNSMVQAGFTSGGCGKVETFPTRRAGAFIASFIMGNGC